MQRGVHVHEQGHCSEHAWIFFFISSNKCWPRKCWVKQWAAQCNWYVRCGARGLCALYRNDDVFWLRIMEYFILNFVRNICIEMRCAEMYLCNWVFIAQLGLWKCKWDSIEFHSISRSISCSGPVHYYYFIVVIWIIFEYIKCYKLPLSKSNAIEWHVILLHPLHISIVLHTIEIHRSQWQ